MTPGCRVTQLYPQALGTHISRLLRHAWVTVGLLFNHGQYTGLISGLANNSVSSSDCIAVNNRGISE
jgi:hypothetical protein